MRKILDYKGFDYQVVEVDYIERKELIAASGQIMVPALRLEQPELGRRRARRDGRRLGPYRAPPGGALAPSRRFYRRAAAACISRSRGISTARSRRRCFSPQCQMRRNTSPARAPTGSRCFALFATASTATGFCDRMEREHAANMVRVREVLEPFEMALEHGAFLLGGPGLADFALYGQLHFLALTGVLKIPHELPRVREFYGRVNRITASLEETGT